MLQAWKFLKFAILSDRGRWQDTLTELLRCVESAKASQIISWAKNKC